MLSIAVSVDQNTPPPPKSSGPVSGITPLYALKFAVALTLFGAGMHYLVSGRKEANWNKMLAGAALALASVFFL